MPWKVCANWNDEEDIGRYISGLANVAALQGHERAWMLGQCEKPG
jgi:hypothetical protein